MGQRRRISASLAEQCSRNRRVSTLCVVADWSALTCQRSYTTVCDLFSRHDDTSVRLHAILYASYGVHILNAHVSTVDSDPVGKLLLQSKNTPHDHVAPIDAMPTFNNVAMNAKLSDATDLVNPLEVKNQTEYR